MSATGDEPPRRPSNPPFLTKYEQNSNLLREYAAKIQSLVAFTKNNQNPKLIEFAKKSISRYQQRMNILINSIKKNVEKLSKQVQLHDSQAIDVRTDFIKSEISKYQAFIESTLNILDYFTDPDCIEEFQIQILEYLGKIIRFQELLNFLNRS